MQPCGELSTAAVRGVSINSCVLSSHFFFFLFLSSFWTSRGHRYLVSSFPPPGTCLQFLSRTGLSNPSACRFLIESRSRAFRKSICLCTRLSPYEVIRVCHRAGLELTNLPGTILDDNLTRRRGDALNRSFYPTTSSVGYHTRG